MAYDYAPLTTAALRLITKFGADLTFRDEGTTGDPVTGLGAVAGANRTLKGVQIKVDIKVFPETVIQTGDRMLLIEGDAVVLTSDKWVFGSAPWQILGVVPIIPNGSDIVASKILVRA